MRDHKLNSPSSGFIRRVENSSLWGTWASPGPSCRFWGPLWNRCFWRQEETNSRWRSRWDCKRDQSCSWGGLWEAWERL